MSKYRVLIADDEEGVRDLCSAIAEDEGYEVITASDGLEAIQKIKQTLPDVILLDVRMPEMDGMEVFQRIKEDLIDSPVIFVTAFGSSDLAIDAMKQGAYNYITKPFDIDEIRIVLKKALELRKLTNEVTKLRSGQPDVPDEVELVGTSQVMQDLFKNIGRCAKNDAPILIQGESGTESDQVARTIHRKTFNEKGTFVEISCYEDKESFSSEIDKIKPLIDSTIYIKDIHLLTSECQSILLKKLSETGGFRLITSTTKDVSQKVKESSFNEELFFKIGAVRIMLPNLNERIEDIEELGNFFLQQLNKKYGKNVKGFTSDTLEILKQYNWPGNVNELKNAITHSMISTNNGLITKENLPPFLFAKVIEQKVDPNDIYSGLTLTNAVKRFETNYIKKTLKIHNGNKTKTAQTLGISRRSLFNKMRSYELLDESS
ncbi:MAG: sigma-54-dependent Fis family transcriptional regulator [Caldisericia bacterium]|nr:sigma-54-dependent Fis family transcriptional regulator [Caldisericia bacterium]